MSIQVVCPECQRKLRVPEAAVGKAVRCPACKAIIPAAEAVPLVEEEELPSQPPPREEVTSARPTPPRLATRHEPQRVRDELVDDDRRRIKKPIRKGSSTGCIVGFVIAAVLLFLGVAGAGVGLIFYFALNRTVPEAEWQPFAPPNSGCTILLPGTPVPQSQNVNGVMLNKYQVERKKEKAVFAVAFIDLNVASLQKDTLDVMTKAERDFMVGRANGKVTNETTISLGNLPGREFQIVASDGGMIIERIYLAKIGNIHRVFLVIVGGNFIKPQQGDAARLFDSFQILVPARPPNWDGAPVAQGQQPAPAVNPPQPNRAPPGQRQPRPRPNRRPNPRAQAGEHVVWNETSGTQTLCLAFSPDSSTLAVGHWDKKLRLWDVAKGQDRQVIPVSGSVMTVAFSSDGKRLACGTDNGDLSKAITLIWDTSDANNPKQLQRIELKHTRDKARAKALCFTPDGKSLAVALVPDSHSGSQVVLWDLENNKERAAYRDCKEDIKQLAFAPDGSVVILMPSSVHVWDAGANQIRREIKAANPAEQFLTTALFPDGQQLVALCQDRKLRIWRLNDGVCAQIWPVTVNLLRLNGSPFESSPDGKYLALRGQAARLYFWDAHTGKELKVANKGTSLANIDVMAFSPDSRLLAWHGNQGPKIVDVDTMVVGN